MASLFTVGENKVESIFYGVIMWAFLLFVFLCMAALASAAASAGRSGWPELRRRVGQTGKRSAPRSRRSDRYDRRMARARPPTPLTRRTTRKRNKKPSSRDARRLVRLRRHLAVDDRRRRGLVGGRGADVSGGPSFGRASNDGRRRVNYYSCDLPMSVASLPREWGRINRILPTHVGGSLSPTHQSALLLFTVGLRRLALSFALLADATRAARIEDKATEQ